MTIQSIISDIEKNIDEFQLTIIASDITDFSAIYRLCIIDNVYVVIYGNEQKDKLNLALIMENIRIYSVDSEGGNYHEHPYTNPKEHKILDKKISIREFLINTFGILKIKGIL